ncbi:hypothetical protein J2X01_001858 [Arthrobacter ginsengisoli]|uniref:Signal transduction histidine kinase dimerisation/phosphoacceptor domain-containing protein n=1 Tax=Arthrobacter ginsengisoli TaxID=1356565 RepID=A0ABU1UBI2_9MICC|nr:hypothetical protein [Arthrobacter ginsengisoli]MDR7082569.1 hypothetical protein [Arthrobacter ginsengisoli]
MKHEFVNPLKPIGYVEPEVLQHETAVRLFIGRVAALVDELDSVARTVKADSPATARHLRLVSQQMSAMALTALETWPKGPQRS